MMHDYMHGLCPNGVLNLAGIWKTHGFVQLWAQLAIHKCNLQRLFLPKAVEDHKKSWEIQMLILRDSGSVPGPGTLCPNLLPA